MDPLKQIYILLRLFFDYIVDYVFSLYYNSNRKYICKPTNILVLESATSLARKIKEKEITSEQVVQAFIDRIKEVNHVLNAVVDDRFEIALLEAKQIDADIKNGKITQKDFVKKQFLGIPFTTKESVVCKKLKVSFGLLSRQNYIGEEDARVVELMKEAGGILLAVTNIPQLNIWTECYNPVYGVTNNPYNTTRNVGGSSGGEACIIAARGSPIGIGTDIGGSLRIPAHRCGIFGHKPTPELISTRGLTFRTGTDDPTMVTAGPMSAYSEDLVPLLKVLLDEKVNKLHLDVEVNIKKINIFYIVRSTCLRSSPISNEMKQLIMKCVEHFNLLSDNKPKRVNFNNIGSGLKLWMYMMEKEADVFTEQITNNTGKANVIVELIKYILMQSEFNLYTIYNIINSKLPKPRDEWASTILDELKAEIMGTLGDNGVLLCPSEAYAAGYHHTSLLRPFNFSYYALWNALKFPVTQVPLGLNKEGMPIGIQVVAAPFQDHLTIAVAKELEKAFGGYVPPFTLE